MSEQEVTWREVTAEEVVELYAIGVRDFEERLNSGDAWHQRCAFRREGQEDWTVENASRYQYRVKVE